jgi:conjugative transfer signal peptidase TraF
MMLDVKLNKKQIKWLLLPFGVIIFVLILKLAGVVINISSSMPLGLYIESKGNIQRGDIVELCLPYPHQKLALERRYIGHGGRCNGVDPVVKQVLAVPGDDVLLADNFIEINRKRFWFVTKPFDGKGRPLNAYPRGEYYNTAGYWVIGTNDPNSWDSRYWGAIDAKQIIAKLYPIFIYENHR